MPDSRDPILDRLLQRAMTASAALFDDLQERLDRKLAELDRLGAGTGEILAAVNEILRRHTDPLVRLLADSELAGWAQGAEQVAAALTSESLEEGGGAAQTPPPPLSPALAPWPALDEWERAGPGRYRWQGTEAFLPLVAGAVEHLQETRLVTRDEWDRLEDEARRRAFTVADLHTEEAIGKVRDAVVVAVETGSGFPDFQAAVEGALGESTLGIGHLENVFRTNTGRAYMAGLEEVAKDPIVSEVFPFRQRIPIPDTRLTELCRVLAKSGIQGTNIYLADDPEWIRTKPLSHWQCRCAVRLLSIRDAAREGIEEAQRWLESGVRPWPPAWVPPPEVELPPGWTSGVA